MGRWSKNTPNHCDSPHGNSSYSIGDCPQRMAPRGFPPWLAPSPSVYGRLKLPNCLSARVDTRLFEYSWSTSDRSRLSVFPARTSASRKRCIGLSTREPEVGASVASCRRARLPSRGAAARSSEFSTHVTRPSGIVGALPNSAASAVADSRERMEEVRWKRY